MINEEKQNIVYKIVDVNINFFVIDLIINENKHSLIL